MPRFAQPDDVSCGPTCLAQVLAWYGDLRSISELTARLRRNPDGGTMAVHLGQLALELGYRARIYPFGVRVFDPTWWELDPAALRARLVARQERQEDPTERVLLGFWTRFLESGGQVRFGEPSASMLVGVLRKDRPLICGLNATWLYRESREDPWTNQPDDIGGAQVGHFVTLVGYTGAGLHIHVNDPSDAAPFAAGGDHGDLRNGRYPLPADRLLHAILLGDSTRDAMVLEIWPSSPVPKHRGGHGA